MLFTSYVGYGAELNVVDSLDYDIQTTFDQGAQLNSEIESNITLELDKYVNQNEIPGYLGTGSQSKSLSDYLITGNEYISLLFGTPDDDDATIADFVVNSQPAGFLRPFISKLINMSFLTLGVVFWISGLRASIDTAREWEFLGRSVSTPFVIVRVGIAVLFLLPTPGGYSLLQTFILYASFLVSSVNNAIYDEAIDLFIDGDDFTVQQTAGGVGISRVEYFKMLSSAICQRVFDTTESENVKIDPALDGYYGISKGRKLALNGEALIGKKDVWYWVDPVSVPGACGSFTVNTVLPKARQDGDSVMSSINERASIFAGGYVNTSSTLIKNQFTELPTNTSQVPTLRYMADKIIRHDEYPEGDLKRDFDKSWIAINKNLGSLYTISSNLLALQIRGLVGQFKEEVKSQGWLMAGANLFRLVTVQSAMSALSNIRITLYDIDRDNLDSGHMEDMDDYIAKVASILDPGQVEGGSAANAAINKIDSNALVAGGANNNLFEYGKYCNLGGFDEDCLGDSYFNNARSLSRELVTNGSLHPLTFFHSFGKVGYEDVKYSYIAATVNVTLVKLVGYAIASGGIFGTQAFGHIMNDTADRVYDFFTTIYKVLGAIFLTMAYYLPMAPLIAWLIIVVDWAVTLFIMVFGAPVFAVFHSFVQGHGFTSEYAQRGYPALLGAIFMPFFMLASLFIYVIVSFAAFKVIGFGFNLALTHLFEIDNMDIIGSIFIWIIMLIAIAMLNSHMISIITNFNDRAMRMFGVHEALTSNKTPDGVEHQSSSHAGTVVNAGAGTLRQIGTSHNLSPVNASGNTSGAGATSDGNDDSKDYPSHNPTQMAGGGDINNDNSSQSSLQSRNDISSQNNVEQSSSGKVVHQGSPDTKGGIDTQVLSGEKSAYKESGDEIEGSASVESSSSQTNTSVSKEDGKNDSRSKASLGDRLKMGAMGVLGAGGNVYGKAELYAQNKNATGNVPQDPEQYKIIEKSDLEKTQIPEEGDDKDLDSSLSNNNNTDGKDGADGNDGADGKDSTDDSNTKNDT